MPVSDDFVSRLVNVVADAALIYCLESDDVFVTALKRMRRELGAKCNTLFPGAPEEMSALVEEVLKCTAVRRNDIIVSAGTLAPLGTRQ
jgi:hypothetical protein